MPWPNDDIETSSLLSNDATPNRGHFLTLFNRVKELIAGRAAVNGVAPLDDAAKVPAANLPRGDADGVAPLDAAAKVPAANLAVSSPHEEVFAEGPVGPQGDRRVPIDGRITGVRVLIVQGGFDNFSASVDADGTLNLRVNFT